MMYGPVYLKKHQCLIFTEGSVEEDPFAGRINVFVCGALQDPAIMTTLLGENPTLRSRGRFGLPPND